MFLCRSTPSTASPWGSFAESMFRRVRSLGQPRSPTAPGRPRRGRTSQDIELGSPFEEAAVRCAPLSSHLTCHKCPLSLSTCVGNCRRDTHEWCAAQGMLVQCSASFDKIAHLPGLCRSRRATWYMLYLPAACFWPAELPIRAGVGVGISIGLIIWANQQWAEAA